MDEWKLVPIGPECFTDEKAHVVVYKGENFYKSCGELVTNKEDGSQSSCVKRIDHPSILHEDYEGNVGVKAELRVDR